MPQAQRFGCVATTRISSTTGHQRFPCVTTQWHMIIQKHCSTEKEKRDGFSVELEIHFAVSFGMLWNQ